MKQIVSNYSYSPATNVVTLTGVNIDADQLLLIVAPQVGRTLYNFASVTGTVSAGADTRVTLNASTAGLTTTSPLVIFYDDQGSTQTIAGTVTANGGDFASKNTTQPAGAIQLGFQNVGGDFVSVKDDAPLPVNLFVNDQRVGDVNVPISGTVTANATILNSAPDYIKVTCEASDLALGDYYLQRTGERLWESGSSSAEANVSIYYNGNGWHCTESANENNIANAPAGDRNNIPPLSGWTLGNQGISFAISYENPLKRQIFGTVTVGNSVTIGSLPSGALTTRFGSVTTANLAFITSAVTNTSRKYLLAQNISAGTVTIGIGFSPTTTQGIQLTAGGGLTFDAFCPTGAVYWLGAVTGAAFTILEG